MQEEKKDEAVRAKATMASVTAATTTTTSSGSNQRKKNPNLETPKVREEGELTSSDDDALPASSATASRNISAPVISSTPNAPARTHVQGTNSGKSISANHLVRSADIQSQTPGYQKGLSKNQVLLKSSNPGWRASDSNDNLVISFSDDDDSGSDHDERRQKTGKSTDRHPWVAKSSGKPPALPDVKLDPARKNASNVRKLAPKKAHLSHTFISSVTKDGPRVGGGGPLLANQRFVLKNTNTAGRNLSNQVRGRSKNVEMSSSKLQDLRQQIAMRENELKLKLLQKNKENVSDPCRDVNVMDQNKVSSRKCSAASSNVQTEHEEPDRKRLKTAHNGLEQLCSSGHVELAESMLVSKEPLLKHPDPLDGSLADHARHDTDVPQRELLLPSEGRQLPPASQSQRSRVLRDAPGVTVSCSLADWISRPRETLAIAKQPTSLTNSASADPLDNSASPDNTGLVHSLGRPTVTRNVDVDVHSLFEIEELHEKELEEAQEQRRRCEIEERIALKAYRRAQRALAEANARCAYLYRRREMYSAQLHSYVMDDSSLLWPSSQQRRVGETWNLNNVAETNLNSVPTSRNRLQPDYEASHLGYDSNVQSAEGYGHYRFSGNEDGHNLGSEGCSEPDASTPELLVQGNNAAAYYIQSQSNERILSPDDDDETFPLDHNVSSSREEDNTNEGDEGQKKMNVDSSTNFLGDGSRDPLLLEAYLRSKLFSRLGVGGPSKQSDVDCNSKLAAQRVAEEDVGAATTQVAIDGISASDCRGECGEDPKECLGNNSKASLDMQNHPCVEEQSLNDSSADCFDAEKCSFHLDISSRCIPSSSIIRSAMKAAGPVSLDGTHVKEQQDSSDVCNDGDLRDQCGQDMLNLDKSAVEVAKCADFGKIDSYTCKSGINPNWPLCMYELRGRCNNDECPWQHVKDYSSRNVNQHNNFDNAECQTGSSSQFQMQIPCVALSSVLTPPRYIICLDSLKAGSHTHGSVHTCQLGSSQKSIFSNSLVLSSSLLKHLSSDEPSDEPYLHGNDGCVETSAGSGHLLYFRSKSDAGNPLRNGLADSDQSLEMALLVLNQEISKTESTKKALSVLSRALEANPALVHLWIVYLLLFYSTNSSVGELSQMSTVREDDLFSYAVKCNGRSYELWLLYIYSRRRLDDRIVAFEKAISSLCTYERDGDEHLMQSSAAILDLFLQMLHCFCMSGNAAKAVQRIYGIVLADTDPDESNSLLLSDILQCLKLSDTCIFWICCVYLVIYRKLPDSLVQQFEFEKDISLIEWPSVHLTLGEKQQVLKLMKVATDSVGLSVNKRSADSDTLSSAHLIAVNHLKLISAIGIKESYKSFLEKYRSSYPSCLELILLSAREHDCYSETADLEGFGEALKNWPKEVPGIQCIWNQYVECALENGRPGRAKEIVEQWFHSVWTPQFLQNQTDAENGDNGSSPADSLSGSTLNSLLSSSNKMDLVFGLLNFSLYKLFQGDATEAHSSIDKALNLADSFEVLMPCLKEHAMFLFYHSSQLKKDVSLRSLPEILKTYIVHATAVHAPEPLTRSFIKDIRKPRLRQLVSNLLSPISPDPFLVNSILDIWFGSSLLPQKFDGLKDLVDFVEAVLEVSPANYQLVISLCRFLCKESDASNTTSASVLFWASSLLVNTIYRAVPVPPEYAWAEAADLLGKLINLQEVSESFHQRALSVYPFSMKLWKSFLNLSVGPAKRTSVLEAAREKGIKLD